MTDRWAKFNQRVLDEFENIKNRLIITVYGSYKPKEEEDFLSRQKQFLIGLGYSETKIVKDYQERSELPPLEISKRCLLYSDVNFLIFTREGKRYGVIRELAYIADSKDMTSKTPYCTVFDQLKDGRGSIPPLSLDDIKNSGIVRQEFYEEKDLQEALKTKAFWYLRKLKGDLESRVDI